MMQTPCRSCCVRHITQVKKVGYSEEDAQALLERAFGWRTQTFWRGLKKEEVPQAEAVAATLDFLGELGALDHQSPPNIS
jgi:hypothetical protein